MNEDASIWELKISNNSRRLNQLNQIYVELHCERRLSEDEREKQILTYALNNVRAATNNLADLTSYYLDKEE